MKINLFIILLLVIINTGRIYGLTVEVAIDRFFEYFSVDEPKGIPVIAFEEPMDLLSPLEIVPITIINGTLLGHSNLSFTHAIVDLLEMKAEMKLTSPRLEIGGKFSWPGFFSPSVGDMNATMVEATMFTNFTMFVNENDTLQIGDAQLIMDNEDLFLNMTNLNFEHELLLATGTFNFFFSEIAEEAFRQMKPLLLDEANKALRDFTANMPPAYRPSSIETKPSLKFFIQRIMTYLGLSPLKLPNQARKILGVNFKATNMVLHGMTVVTDIESLFLIYHSKKFYFEFEMTYPKLLLMYSLGLSSGSYLSFDVYEKNQLNNVNLRVKLIIDPSQKEPPLIRDLSVYVESFGKIRDGRKTGFFRSLRNFFVDVADDVRNEIIGALTGPVKRIIQSELDKMDLEKAMLYLAQLNQD